MSKELIMRITLEDWADGGQYLRFTRYYKISNRSKIKMMIVNRANNNLPRATEIVI